MKKTKLILPMLAFMIAIVGAFTGTFAKNKATAAIQADWFDVTQDEGDRCVSCGLTDQENCSTNPTPVICTCVFETVTFPALTVDSNREDNFDDCDQLYDQDFN